MKLVLFTLIVLLDVLVVTPWVQALVPAPPGVERAWAFLIPLAISAITAIAAKKKQDAAKKAAAEAKKPLDALLSYQTQRMRAAEPLNQANLALAASMMPAHMKQAGGAIDQWTKKYESGSLPGMTNDGRAVGPRNIVSGPSGVMGSAEDQMLAFQKARLAQAEPLTQANLFGGTSLLGAQESTPSVGAWTEKYNAQTLPGMSQGERIQGAAGLDPRYVSEPQPMTFGGANPRAITSAMLAARAADDSPVRY